ncbi:hypothetical protein BDY21DRAFT_330583 [Lineolata rhizophorae]|uniref:Uncharacterized protein n=1 Tax=Lineolata rhizophorae TaxID=578093 RepID=A0A6A6PEA2_9PEZI|nr:hypothetical protein BDY21DRAFT_330583 [Lineolata rhizophorae]
MRLPTRAIVILPTLTRWRSRTLPFQSSQLPNSNLPRLKLLILTLMGLRPPTLFKNPGLPTSTITRPLKSLLLRQPILLKSLRPPSPYPEIAGALVLKRLVTLEYWRV